MNLRLPSLLLLAATMFGAVAAPVEPAVDYADRVLSSLNDYRASQGLAPLRADSRLSQLAAEHSVAMASQGKPSHDGFRARFVRAGGYVCVENVAAGFRVPEQVTMGWRGSPAHHRNLLEPRVRVVGVANQGSFVTYFACDETA